MKVSVTMEIEVPREEHDSRSDCEHYLLNFIYKTIQDGDNKDDIFEKLRMNYKP